MATQLATRSFFVGERYSIADIALYAYTHSAEVVGLSVSPTLKAWFERVRSQPGHVRIKRDPLRKAP